MKRFEIEDDRVKDLWSKLPFNTIDSVDTRLKDKLYEYGFLPIYDVVDNKGIIPDIEIKELTLGKIKPQHIKRIILPFLYAISTLHEKGEVIGNFDIDYVTLTDRGMYLSNLGCGIDVTSKNDYTPFELYLYKPKAKPVSDVYAVSCFIYELITGIHLMAANDREEKDSEYEPLYAYGVESKLEDAIDKGLNIHSADRFKDMKEFIDAIYTEEEIEDFINDEDIFFKDYKKIEEVNKKEEEVKEEAKEEVEEEVEKPEEEDYYKFYERKEFWIKAILAILIISGLGLYAYFNFFNQEEEVRYLEPEVIPVSEGVNYEHTYYNATGPAASVSGSAVSESAVEVSTPIPISTPEPTPKPTKKPKKTKKPKPTKKPKKSFATQRPYYHYETHKPNTDYTVK